MDYDDRVFSRLTIMTERAILGLTWHYYRIDTSTT